VGGRPPVAWIGALVVLRGDPEAAVRRAVGAVVVVAGLAARPHGGAQVARLLVRVSPGLAAGHVDPRAEQARHGQRAAAEIGDRVADVFGLGLRLRLGPAQAPGQVLVELLGVADRAIELGVQPGKFTVG
jgi:hypothetical protein